MAEISDSFNVDLTRTRFAFSIVSLFYATSFLMFGPAADRFDLQKMSSAGLFFSATGVFAAAIAGNFKSFIISMAVIGICASAVAASMFPYMVKIAPEEKKGIYLGSIVSICAILISGCVGSHRASRVDSGEDVHGRRFRHVEGIAPDGALASDCGQGRLGRFLFAPVGDEGPVVDGAEQLIRVGVGWQSEPLVKRPGQMGRNVLPSAGRKGPTSPDVGRQRLGECPAWYKMGRDLVGQK